MPNSLETAIAHQIHAIVNWFSRQREQALDRDEARRIADDLGISVDDLIELGTNGEDRSALMTRMLDVHGLDRALLEEKYAAVVRDMALGCSRCANKGECRHDLDNGTAADTFDRYCVNAGTIRSFVESGFTKR